VLQEPVRLSEDRQPRRAGNTETPVLLTALRSVLNPEMPALPALQQPGKLLPVGAHDVIHPARLQPSGSRHPRTRVRVPRLARVLLLSQPQQLHRAQALSIRLTHQRRDQVRRLMPLADLSHRPPARTP